MGDKTKIEWTDATWNPVTGCTPVSEGCEHCYAARYARRGIGDFAYELDETADFSISNWPAIRKRPFSEVRTHPERLEKPLHWRKPRMVFIPSMGDLFHEKVPDDFIDKVFAVMALCPQHKFQVLTKRSKRMLNYLSKDIPELRLIKNGSVKEEKVERIDSVINAAFEMNTEQSNGLLRWSDKELLAIQGNWPIPNIWIGVTVENQDQDERIGHLLQTPAAVRFVSVEPMLGPIDFTQWINKCSYYCDHDYSQGPFGHRPEASQINWIILGAESGPGARPMHPDWPRKVRDDCQIAGVPFHFKGWGEWASLEAAGSSMCDWKPIGASEALYRIHIWEDKEVSLRIGKKATGRLLDGREWLDFPRTA